MDNNKNNEINLVCSPEIDAYNISEKLESE
jgi:hypothetical protein